MKCEGEEESQKKVEEELCRKDHKLLGKYELGKLIGRGALAKVYQATNLGTGQSVAIKSISKRKVIKAGLIPNILREISIMHRMRHPHVAKLYEVLATKSKIHLVMEFAKGGELFAKLAKGRFSENLSRRYFQQLISAVGYCHSRGVSHRDLKPENILLDENWDLKVTDFGLSAVAKDGMQSDCMLHTMCGTPGYVAPEIMIMTMEGYDGRKADIWSCGVILYVLNAGYLPFNDPNIMAMYSKIYKGQFRCPIWTSPDLKMLLSRLLDPSPETRISVDEILNDRWFKEGQNETRFETDEVDCRSHGGHRTECLNAFDIISQSPGYDLSGLISGPDVAVSGECFLSEMTPEMILEMVEGVAVKEGVRVMRKKERGIKLEEENGNMVVNIEINRLTDKLVVVEIEKRDEGIGTRQKIWNDKLRPQLATLIYQPAN